VNSVATHHASSRCSAPGRRTVVGTSTRLAAAGVALALVAAGCGAKGESSGGDEPTDDTTVTTASTGGGAEMFGTMESPCGEGDAKVNPDEAGKGADKLYIGAASDKGASIRQGLLGEMYDAGMAFAKWCNAQGGIQGLQIEVVDLDGKLFEVNKAMVTACKDVFAMVGGGNALDAQQFSGKPESDFHLCKLIDIPGFANMPEKADSNGYVAPIPNRTSPRSVTFWQEFAESHPEEIKKSVIVYSDAVKYNKAQIASTLKVVPGWEVIDEINYPAAGNIDFKLVSQRIKSSGAEVVNLVGEPTAAAGLVRAFNEDGIDPWMLMETNFYSPELLEVGDLTEKLVVRTVAHPFEEADKWPGTKAYLDMMKAYQEDDPNARIAALGVQSTSAWLLFATAAKKCGSEGDKVITRDCVLKEAGSITEWTGGGMHAQTNPAENLPSECIAELTVKGDQWARLEPELGADNDNGEGFICREDGVQELPDLAKEYEGDGKIDPSRGS
jgi:ABC-type branched-subunit amino acid transport system substrate-binding protein